MTATQGIAGFLLPKGFKMNNLVTVTNGVPSTNSVVIAELFSMPHKNILRALDKLAGRLNFEPSFYLAGNGKQEKCYMLNERQALIVMPFIGGQKSIQGQIALVDAFLAMRNHISEASTVEKRLSNLESELAALKQVDSMPILSFQEQAKKVIERYIEKHKNEKLTARQIALGLREAKPFKNNGGYKAVKSTLVTISVLM